MTSAEGKGEEPGAGGGRFLGAAGRGVVAEGFSSVYLWARG